jgi:cbb3-type cytochrome oxidase subunit 1
MESPRKYETPIFTNINNLSKAFVASAILYFALGATAGFIILLSRIGSDWSAWDYYLIPSHTHLNLLGWMSMTIYAMGYRAFPAFFGKSLYSIKLAWVHFWLSNIGLIGMAIFFFLNRVQEGSWTLTLALFGGIQIIGIYLFIFNMGYSILSKPRRDPPSSPIEN